MTNQRNTTMTNQNGAHQFDNPYEADAIAKLILDECNTIEVYVVAEDDYFIIEIEHALYGFMILTKDAMTVHDTIEEEINK